MVTETRLTARRGGRWAELGQAIMQAREDRGWDQQTLAERIDKSASYLSRVEGGIRHPSPDTLRTIARELGVDYTPLARLAGYADDERAPLDPETVRFLQFPRRIRRILNSVGERLADEMLAEERADDSAEERAC